MSSDPATRLNSPPVAASTSSAARRHYNLAPPHPPTPSSATLAPREYRRGNWTLHETLILITAKRLDDERRSRQTTPFPCSSLDIKPGGKPNSSPSSSPQCRSAELRWKWVENYCWQNGCLRSQNQCYDKWDNLLRDYKKVRDFEERCGQNKVDGGSSISYWAMEKRHRKDANLPSNLLAEVFHAITDVLSRRDSHKERINADAVANAAPSRPLLVPTITTTAPSPPPLPVNHHSQAPQQQRIPTSPASPPPAAVKQRQVGPSVPATAVGTRSTSASSERRKKGAATESEASVVKAAYILARTLTECEEKREKRHREMMEMEERRLRAEAERMEMSRHGFDGLITSVSDLSGAIHAVVSGHPSRRRDER